MPVVYCVRRHSIELRIRQERALNQIVPGCTAADSDPELIGQYGTEKEARRVYDAMSGDISFTRSQYGGWLAHVSEPVLEAYEVDGEGEYVETLWEDYNYLPSEFEWDGVEYEFDVWSRRWVRKLEDDEEPEIRTWYAVMRDAEDTDWGYGSCDRSEALRMARQMRDGGYPDVYIAVIEEQPDDKTCVDEIHDLDEED